MNKEKIVVYGTGIDGERFYYKYKETYEIVFYVDKTGNRKFHGLQVYALNEALEKIKNYFVVVATARAEYNELKKQWGGVKFVEFKNFVWMQDLGKKIAILYGNCHMDVLEKYLINNPYFYSEYIIKRKLVNYTLVNEPSDEEMSECDLLLCQDIREGNELGVLSADELVRKTSPKCISIKIVNLHGYNLFFPQMDRKINNIRGKRDYLVHKHINHNAIDIPAGSDKYTQISLLVKQICTLDYRIENLLQQGASVKEIVDEIQNGAPYSKEEIFQIFNSGMERIKEREKHCDIKISDYIENNYRNKQLFYDPNHPTEDLMAEVGRRVLRLLHIECYEINSLPKMINARENFIYGCVKKALGIVYDIKFIRFGCINSSLSNKAIDLETFVSDYVTWFTGGKEKVHLEYDNIIGYGVGQYYEEIKDAFRGKVKIDYLCDVRWKEGGGEYDGIKIISTEKIRDLSNALVIIFSGNTQNYSSICSICKDLQVDYIHADMLLESIIPPRK